MAETFSHLTSACTGFLAETQPLTPAGLYPAPMSQSPNLRGILSPRVDSNWHSTTLLGPNGRDMTSHLSKTLTSTNGTKPQW